MLSIEAIASSRNKIMAHYAKKLGYDEDQISTFVAVLDSIKTIMDEKVRPNIMEWDRVGTKLKDGKVVFPPKYEETMNELMVDNEMLSFFIPEKFGGYGYENVFQAALTELMAQYDIPLQISTTISFSVLEALIIYHNPVFNPIIQEFIDGKRTGYVAFTEPQAGSYLENVKSTSELDGDEYVLNGTKIFISNGGYANTGLFLAQNIVDGEKKGTNVLLVDKLDGITTVRLEDKAGLKANPTAQLLFEDVRVPKEHIIATVGDGYRKVLERLMGMRIGVIFQAVGAAMRSYELAKQYAEERTQFGKPINSFDGVSRKLHEMEKEIPRLRAFGYQASFALDRYYRGWIPSEVGATGNDSELMAAKSIPESARIGLTHYMISQAKLYCAEIAQSLTYDAQQIFGGNGFVSEYEINKVARDIRVLPIYEGTSEIHEWLIDRAFPALQLLPKYKRLTEGFDGTTVYERILFERFPGLKDKI